MTRIRYIAAAASAATGILYLLIGFEVLYIGESTSGSDPGLLGFGLMAGGTFIVATILLLLVQRRWVWIAVSVLNALVIVAYFAMAGLREPPFEWPGLLVKGPQVVTLLATTALAIRGQAASSAAASATLPASDVALAEGNIPGPGVAAVQHR